MNQVHDSSSEYFNNASTHLPVSAQWTRLLCQDWTDKSVSELINIAKNYPIASLPKYFIDHDKKQSVLLRVLHFIANNSFSNLVNEVNELIDRPADLSEYQQKIEALTFLLLQDRRNFESLVGENFILLLENYLMKKFNSKMGEFLYATPANDTNSYILEIMNRQFSSPPISKNDNLEIEVISMVKELEEFKPLAFPKRYPIRAQWTQLLVEPWTDESVFLMTQCVKCCADLPMRWIESGTEKHVFFKAIDLAYFVLAALLIKRFAFQEKRSPFEKGGKSSAFCETGGFSSAANPSAVQKAHAGPLLQRGLIGRAELLRLDLKKLSQEANRDDVCTRYSSGFRSNLRLFNSTSGFDYLNYPDNTQSWEYYKLFG